MEKIKDIVVMVLTIIVYLILATIGLLLLAIPIYALVYISKYIYETMMFIGI